MANLGIDGLASGLDTTSLINQLMRVEAMPQTLLKTKQTTTQSLVSALQGLNTRVASLADAATKAATPAAWDAFTATSTSPSVTTSVSGGAQGGSITFSVDALATSQTSLSRATADDGSLLGEATALTIKKHDGTLVTVQPAGTRLDDIATAINAATDGGVRATVVRVSSGGDGTEPQFRLQLTGASTGENASFEVYAGTAEQVQASSPEELAALRVDGNLVRASQDATVTLWKDTPFAETFSQGSNTFTGLMTGVDVTVSKVTGADEPPVTVAVERDTAAVTKVASGLVGAMGVVLSEIASRTAISTTIDPNGSTKVTGGILTGDSAVRGIRQQLTSALSMPSGGVSPSEVGIVLGRDGTFTFDEERFSAALAADPARTQSLVAELAQRVADVAKGASDRFDGTLTRKIQGQENLVKTMGSEIESWDRRLELRRAGLQRTYAALEVTLSNLSSQSNWLAGQLNSLPSYKNS